MRDEESLRRGLSGQDGRLLELVGGAEPAQRRFPHRGAGSAAHPRRGTRSGRRPHRLSVGHGPRYGDQELVGARRVAAGAGAHQVIRHRVHDLLPDQLHGDFGAAAQRRAPVRDARPRPISQLLDRRQRLRAAGSEVVHAAASGQPRILHPGAGADDLRRRRRSLCARAAPVAVRREGAYPCRATRRAVLRSTELQRQHHGHRAELPRGVQVGRHLAKTSASRQRRSSSSRWRQAS